ncbi:MAG: YggS family pyridoxal phosphate-dependent enzyme [Duncaniella sp.]|uniref:YggS family pyridoxal phosphate-dependent enzyme n=1 Tax=Duncaniella sp. TaxID=2518496 RepID=UPI0023D1BE27|nr:YggS family pyridoxal phosphate-dependent enzyme [Duncaniella sp.]MDE5988891.1 YggS family pyridoxal phosphate-dependent enzyme [Duncaniella sp.]
MAGSVTENLQKLNRIIPQGVTLVAVSKFHPLEALAEAYEAGQRVFGESRALELDAKAAQLPEDIEWHFIGHLQTNKVKKVVARAAMIHSVDSDRLLQAIDAEAVKAGRRTGVLLQLHVAREETKFGFTPAELLDFVTPRLVESLKGVEIRGVMGMASNVDDDERIRADFREIRAVFDRLKTTVFASSSRFDTVSMGMSHDWPIAVEEGSTMVRVGTSIFGEREY